MWRGPGVVIKNYVDKPCSHPLYDKQGKQLKTVLVQCIAIRQSTNSVNPVLVPSCDFLCSLLAANFSTGALVLSEAKNFAVVMRKGWPECCIYRCRSARASTSISADLS